MSYFESELNQVNPYAFYGKSFSVDGPGELRFAIDFDDVDHGAVVVLADQMVNILNAHWVPIKARRCADPEAAFEAEDFDSDQEYRCAVTLLPLDGPIECPNCGGDTKEVTVG